MWTQLEIIENYTNLQNYRRQKYLSHLLHLLKHSASSRCTIPKQQVQTPQLEDDRPRRRGFGLQSGENYHDLGLNPEDDRQLQLMRRLGSEALLKGEFKLVL